MNISKGYIVSLYHSKGVSHHHLGFAKIQKKVEEWESFIVEKKRKCRVCPDWRLLA